MKLCRACKAENNEVQKFCISCGSELVGDLERFLSEHQLQEHLDLLLRNDLHSLDQLSQLKDADLDDLGLPLGDKLKLKKALDIAAPHLLNESTEYFDKEETSLESTPSVEELKERALNDPEAMWYLGDLFKSGSHGIEQNHEEATRWYSRSAKSGSPTGMLKYGEALYLGEGVKKDDFESAKWLRKASELGIKEAQFSYTERLEQTTKGYQLDRALQGDATAQMKIVKEYPLKGNDSGIRQWLKSASDQGDVNALKLYGTIVIKYIIGNSNTASKEELEIIKKAEKAGLIEATHALKYFSNKGASGIWAFNSVMLIIVIIYLMIIHAEGAILLFIFLSIISLSICIFLGFRGNILKDKIPFLS